MPQNQLQDLLLNRVGQGQGSDQALPESIPGQQPGMLDKGMDVLLSGLGLRGQKPGDPWTGAGAALGAAVPMLPFGKMGALKGVAEGPSKTSQLLEEIFAANPAARGLYEKAMASQIPEALAAKQAAGTARYGQQANRHDALLDLLVDRPRPIPSDTGFETAIPTGNRPPIMAGTPPPPAISQGYGQGTEKVVNNRLSQAGLTKDQVLDIRQIGHKAAALKYPEIPATKLYEIASGGVFGGIR